MNVDPALAQFLAESKADPQSARRRAIDSVPPETRLEWQTFHQRQGHIVAAMAKPLPGAAGDAFLKPDVVVAGRKINSIKAATWALLQDVESPLIAMFQNAAAQGTAKVNWTAEQRWYACLIFTEDVKRLYALKSSKGIDAVKAEAVEKVCDWSEAEVDAAMLGIMEQTRRHGQTVVKHLSDAKEGGGIDPAFFEDQPAARS